MVEVRFTRPPTKAERARLKKGVPVPLSDGFDLSGAHLLVGSGQDAHVQIAETYGDGRLASSGRIPFAKDADVARFNADIERWLREAHAICPVLVAYRAEDGEAGGTELSAWHASSVQRIPEVLAALDASDARLAAALRAIARSAGVRLPADRLAPNDLAKALPALAAQDVRVAADELLRTLVPPGTPSAPLTAAARRVAKANTPFGTELATRAYQSAIGGDILRARALFDIVLDNPDLPLPSYCNALYALKAVDGDDMRALRPLYQRFLARCLPFGAKNPAIHINAAGVRLVMDDRDEDGALAELERAHALGAPELPRARETPDFRRFHGNPRFEALFRKAAKAKRSKMKRESK